MSSVRSEILIFDRDLVEERDYWVNKLSPAVGATTLATDHRRRGCASRARDEAQINLGLEVSQKLNRLTRGGPFLIYTTLMAALKVCLSKYNDSDIIVVGSPSLKEEDRQAQPANALAIVDKVEGDIHFRQFLMNVRQTLLDAYARQRFPFKQLVKELGFVQEDADCPLFNVALALADIHTELPDVNNDITITFRREPDQIAGRISYNADLFRQETIKRLASHYINVLGAALENTDIPIKDISILSEAEQHQIIIEWVDSKADYLEDACAHELFQTQAERSPDAVSVIFEDQHLSYEELNRRANQLAHHLKRLDVGPEVLVGICVERSLEMVIGLLGILKAGAAYLPLDPAYPPDRLAFMLDDSQAPVLLTQKRLLERLSGLSAQVVCLDSDSEIIREQPTENPVTGINSKNLAYVIYTSGSTGRPKGTLVQHKGLCNLSQAQVRAFQLEPGNSVLQFASLSFDASIFEIVMALAVGSKLCLARQEELLPGAGLIELLRRHQITNLTITPTALGALPVEELPHLRTVIVAGEACPAELVERWSANRDFYNAYGPTEATVWATVARCNENASSSTPAIGRPIQNTRVYVLDREMNSVGIGARGEIHIGGVGIARGYLGQAELTAERFIPDANSEEEGARVYRTSDIGRYRGDGEIEFGGRKDEQVKVRGYRIELGEIERVLNQFSKIKDTVVVAHEGRAGDKRLVAYLVSDNGQPLIISEVRGFLEKSLPEYMIPSIFMTMDSLPLTANGKVDRRALPPPEMRSADLDKAYVAPRTRTEIKLTAIWEQVLGVERIGIHHSFSELGGHSLHATQIMSRVLESFQVEIPLRRLFEVPTIAQLAESIEEEMRTAKQEPISPIKRVPREATMPLSFAQQRLWFLDQFVPDSPLYNVPGSVRLAGVLSRGALEQSFSEVVRRHEVLRTRFESREGEPVQIICPTSPVTMQAVDLTGLNERECRLQAQALASREASRPFDLGRGPLLRTALLQLREDDQVLLLTIHHIACDEWSMDLLQAELRTHYEAYLQGQPSPLEDLQIQYADYSVWQRQWLQGEVLDQQMGYWRQQLAGVPALLELPTDRPRPMTQSHRGATQRIVIKPDVVAGLKALSRAEGVTLFTVVLAAYKALLMKYSGQRDIVVGTPVSGRNRVEIERLVGFFVNTLALRSELHNARGFRGLVNDVSRVLLEAQAHQEIPFEKLVEELKLERSLSYSPLIQVMMTWQSRKEIERAENEEESRAGKAQIGTAKFDLTLSMRESGDKIIGSIGYNRDLFDSSRIRRMEGHLQVLLEAIVTDADCGLWALPILKEAEREQIIRQWNDTGNTFASGHTIKEIFENQVETSPEAVAVVFNEETVTYSELNRRANQLGRYMTGLGIAPEDLVGICLSRSIEMVVGILGVVKSGGAFLPLDPAYPQQRLNFMLEDSHAKALLTEARLVGQSGEQTPKIVCIDTDWDRIALHDERNTSSQASPDNLAYVIYTSGSTGRPKGTLVQHKGLCNLSQAQVRAFQLEPENSVLQFASLSFDASIFEIVMALAVGSKLCLARQEELLPGAGLIELLRRHQITNLTITPTALGALPVEELPHLRTVIVAGEACPAELVERWSANRDFYNAYGPTETTVWATVGRCEGKAGSSTPAIGRPIQNTRVYVLDKEMNSVGIGARGEIHIGGVGIARGYLGQAELTAERFIPDANSEEEGARVYRTSDIGRYRGDGEIEFGGRKDEQVKVRGYRIELGEIEATLRQNSEVDDCVVVVREDRAGDKRLTAYIVVNQESALSIGGLRRQLQERLPDYMIPAAFIFLEALPLTANGKVDRRALPASQDFRPNLEISYAAPTTEIERIIASVWQEVLHVEKVGVHDNFFDLGGHSLLIMQVKERIQKAIEREISVVDLFKYPTIGSLAEYLAQQGDAGPSLPQVEDQLEDEERLREVTKRQQQLRLSYQAAMAQEGVQHESL